MNTRIITLPGDGIGPEVTDSACRVLQAAGERFGHHFEFSQFTVGGAAIDKFGVPLPEETLAACKESDAILLGAVGGPKWDHCAVRPEQGLLELRRQLGVFANLRPVVASDALLPYSPLKPENVRGTNLLIVRELTGGIYFGQPRGRTADTAFDTMIYSRGEIVRVATVAFDQARMRRGRVVSVDKANVLESSRLWREVVTELALDYPDVELEHQLVDSAAAALVCDPRHFDVLLTSNLFGDILSDQAGALTGSLGVLPSASIGANDPGLFEPVHGSAPAIAGKGTANPIGAILAAAMLYRHGLALPEVAIEIETAVARTLEAGLHTSDLKQTASLSTERFTEEVVSRLETSNCVNQK